MSDWSETRLFLPVQLCCDDVILSSVIILQMSVVKVNIQVCLMGHKLQYPQ